MLLLCATCPTCFMNPAVCYHRFELCVDAESANDCNVHLAGSTIFAKFVSNLICQVFISTVLTILTSKQSFGAPALSIIFFPSQGILSFSCLQTISVFSGHFRLIFAFLLCDTGLGFCCLLPSPLMLYMCIVFIHCIMLQHCFLCCYSVSQ